MPVEVRRRGSIHHAGGSRSLPEPAPDRYRHIVMRRHLGSVLLAPLVVLVLALAGCGGDNESGTITDDPAPSPSGSSKPAEPDPDDGQVDFELVAMITETAVGGKSGPAVSLSDDDSVQQFTSQFDNDSMETRLQDVVQKTEIPDGMLLYGAVVAIGCDAPTDVLVTNGDTGLVITALKVPSPMQECFAPMTTVAVVLVPTDVVS
jgi:hypothetical protein